MENTAFAFSKPEYEIANNDFLKMDRSKSLSRSAQRGGHIMADVFSASHDVNIGRRDYEGGSKSEPHTRAASLAKGEASALGSTVRCGVGVGYKEALFVCLYVLGGCDDEGKGWGGVMCGHHEALKRCSVSEPVSLAPCHHYGEVRFRILDKLLHVGFGGLLSADSSARGGRESVLSSLDLKK